MRLWGFEVQLVEFLLFKQATLFREPLGADGKSLIPLLLGPDISYHNHFVSPNLTRDIWISRISEIFCHNTPHPAYRASRIPTTLQPLLASQIFSSECNGLLNGSLDTVLQILIDFILYFQFAPNIRRGNEAFVHHILLYECDGNFNETDFDQGVNCFSSANMPYFKCRESTLVGAWAVGGNVRHV